MAVVAGDDRYTIGENKESDTYTVLSNDSATGPNNNLKVTSATVLTGLGTAAPNANQNRLVYDSGGAYNYLAEGETATVTVRYFATKANNETDDAIATFTIQGRNDVPTANDDVAAAVEDGPAVTGNVITGSDTDPDTSDVLSVVDVSGGAVGRRIQGDYGTLILNADGSYSYSADADLLDTVPTGTTGLKDVFTYKVSDGKGGTDTATLTINVALADDDRTYTGTGGSDTITGDQDRAGAEDTINGRDGNDKLFGLAGADTLNGGDGNDELYGGDGIDRLNGGSGNDYLDGGQGADFLDGGDANDILLGGDGRDQLLGGSGNDQLDGGDGRDLLAGGSGNDLLTGGAGNDLFVFSRGGNSDTVIDFEVGRDLLQLDGVTIRSIVERDVDRNGTLDTVVQFSSGMVTLLNVSGVTADQLTGTEGPGVETRAASHDLLL
ncbi:MAG TPA: Ig-like domain-containing protein [Allosphingosinicella sp.]|jgi:VCBS repeat-containing protein